jgi:2-polyprenyl-3-methyl-5-hydroxy-6-metoxy-1,4-benzoquinol methylase
MEHWHRYQMLSQIPLENKRVLDIACGEGYGSALIAENKAFRVIGVDIDSEAIAHASSTYRADNLEYLQGSCTSLPVPTGSIDIVTSFETIEHIPKEEHVAFLHEVKNVLWPDGLLIISSPNKHVHEALRPPNPYHISEMELDEFHSLLAGQFKYVKLYLQRYISASVIIPAEHMEGKKLNLYAAVSTDTGFRPVRSLEDVEGQIKKNFPEYYIALCSDVPIKPLEGSCLM